MTEAGERQGNGDPSDNDAAVSDTPRERYEDRERDGAGEPDAVAAALAAAVAALDGQERPGQLRMAQAVAGAIDGEGHLLVQAGTGTGKSLAYLVPAVLHAQREDGGPVVVATATLALQRQLVERDLPRLADALEPVTGRRPTFAVLKGRHNYLCRDRLERGAAADDEDGLFDVGDTGPLGRQARRLRAWAEQTTTGDRDEFEGSVDARVWRAFSVSSRECVGRTRCAFGEECFAEAAREAARDADVVVTNHAMLAIDVLEGVPVLPEHDAVVVDEGHELVDRCTQAVTLELSARAVERASARSRRLIGPEAAELVDAAADDLADALREAADAAPGPMRLDPIGRDLMLALTGVRDAGHAALTALTKDKADASDVEGLAARQRARAALEEVHDVAGKLLALTEHDVAWLDPGFGRPPALRVAPLSVSGLLRASLFERAPVVVTSATLTVGGTFDLLAGSLGLTAGSLDPTAGSVGETAGPTDETGSDGRWTGLDVGSPFDHRRQGILYVARHLPPPGRDGVAPEALDELLALVRAAGGRTLALFSSWRGVERAHEHLAAAGVAPLLVQRRGDVVGDLVARFAADDRSTLLGTLSLWQGVDVPGSACTCVVIDRIPFPRPDDPLLAARQRAVDEAGGSGFRAVAVPRAGLMLAQGVGRLIRGPDDRGVVAVLDPRLVTAAYGATLRAGLPPFWLTTDRDVVLGALRRLDASLS